MLVLVDLGEPENETKTVEARMRTNIYRNSQKTLGPRNRIYHFAVCTRVNKFI